MSDVFICIVPADRVGPSRTWRGAIGRDGHAVLRDDNGCQTDVVLPSVLLIGNEAQVALGLGQTFGGDEAHQVSDT